MALPSQFDHNILVTRKTAHCGSNCHILQSAKDSVHAKDPSKDNAKLNINIWYK